MPHTIGELSTKDTTLLQTSFQSELYRESYAPPKVAVVPSLRISGLPLGNLGTKRHLDVAPVERCRVYYKGEGGGFPQVRAVVSLVSSSLLVACPSTKGVPTMH
jgi:hypothetical protein